MLAQYTPRGLGLSATGGIAYSSQGNRSWSQVSSYTPGAPQRTQQSSVRHGPATDGYQLPPVVAVGLRHMYIYTGTDVAFTSSLVPGSLTTTHFVHRATVLQDTRVSHLSFRWMSFPAGVSAGGFMMLTGGGSLTSATAGSASGVPVVFSTAFAELPQVAVFFRGIQLDVSDNTATAAATTTQEYELQVKSSEVTTSGFRVSGKVPAVAAGGVFSPAAVLEYSWVAFGKA